MLVEGGLGSIEAAGPGLSNRLSRRFRDWAGELGLVPIAGSDFHIADRPGAVGRRHHNRRSESGAASPEPAANLTSDGTRNAVESGSQGG